jgi:hypothetical protein
MTPDMLRMRPCHNAMMQTFIYDCTPHFVQFAYEFTGKERDTESGLDYAGASKHSSINGA